MRYVCSECGNEIDSDMDFCPACGCMRDKAFVFDDKGYVSNVCPACGEPYLPGDRYCGKCGTEIPDSVRPMMTPKLRSNGTLAIALALLPGFFNIFGLGHFVLKQYARGAMFLVMTLVLWFLNDWSWRASSVFTMFLDVAVYFYQCMDILRYAYAPEEK
ncbi:MAG: zinc ribbon domain-containing protein [Thermoplasmata archaeon]|nr:zinc ribbon domain-containing protein [Thermoplasmata archaeon]